jgi:hypothetical protein
MLSLLITKFKNILIVLLMGALILTSISFTSHANDDTNEYIKVTVVQEEVQSAIAIQQNRECDIVIRVGEYNGKAGKRVYIDNLSWALIPTDIPIHKDNEGHYVQEFDINNKIATRVYQQLLNKGVNVKLQIAESKQQDLNSAGRISNKSNPYIYLSMHTNSWKSDSSGYFGMYNTNDAIGKRIAQRLSDSIKDNGMIRQTSNRNNKNGYIGEMNAIHESTIPVLMEMGFFSNTQPNGDLYYLLSDEYSDYISEHLTNELVNILNELK